MNQVIIRQLSILNSASLIFLLAAFSPNSSLGAVFDPDDAVLKSGCVYNINYPLDGYPEAISYQAELDNLGYLNINMVYISVITPVPADCDDEFEVIANPTGQVLGLEMYFPRTKVLGTEQTFSVLLESSGSNITRQTATQVLDVSNSFTLTGIDYSLLETPEEYDSGISWDIQPKLGGGILADYRATRDGVYVAFIDHNKISNLAPYYAMEGSNATTHVAKIPYEPVIGCKDWCFDWEVQGVIQDLEVNELDDGDFDASVLMQSNNDGRFYIQYFPNGFQEEVMGDLDSTGRWVPWDPETPWMSFPTEYAYSKYGYTSTFTRNNSYQLIMDTRVSDNQGSIWEEITALDNYGDWGEAAIKLIGGQETVYIVTGGLTVYKMLSNTVYRRLPLDEMLGLDETWEISQLLPNGEDAYLLLERPDDGSWDPEDGNDLVYVKIIKISELDDNVVEIFDTTYEQNNGFHDFTIAVSPNWIYLSDGKAIRIDTNQFYDWLGMPDRRKGPSEVRLAAGVGAFGLLGASDDTVVVAMLMNCEQRIARVTPRFRPLTPLQVASTDRFSFISRTDFTVDTASCPDLPEYDAPVYEYPNPFEEEEVQGPNSYTVGREQTLGTNPFVAEVVVQYIVAYDSDNFTNTYYEATYNDNGRLDGELRLYNTAGQLLAVFMLENGKGEGPFIFYRPSGVPLREGRFVDGYLEGVVKTYHPNGVLREETTYEYQLREGPYRRYDENGLLLQEGQYKDAKSDGIWKHYRNGSEYETVVWSEGQIIRITPTQTN